MRHNPVVGTYRIHRNAKGKVVQRLRCDFPSRIQAGSLGAWFFRASVHLAHLSARGA
jgi:hypothetical protein